MGRPTKLDDLRAQAVINAVSEGLPRDTAARLARIAPSTLFDWLARGRDGESRFAEFAERVKEAEAQAEQKLIAVIREAAPKQWQAAAWLLERRRPEAYAITNKREFVHEDDAAKSEQADDDLDVARSVLAALESKRSGTDG